MSTPYLRLSIAHMRLSKFASALANVQFAPPEIREALVTLQFACYARRGSGQPAKDAMPPLAERRAAVRLLRERGVL